MNQIYGESKMEFEERKKFSEFLTSKNIKNVEKNSKIYCNIKFRNCRYSSKLYNFIKKLEEEFNTLDN